MKSLLIRALAFASFVMIPVRRRRNLRQLEHLHGPRQGAAKKGCVTIAAHYGNHAAVRHFLDHHRRLGVDEFVFLDLSSDGGLAKQLTHEPNCAVWRPRKLQPCGRISRWENALRQRYALGRWCLSLDTSDAFVFYRCETRTLADFTDFLESESRDHAFALLLEMYGDRPASDLSATSSSASLPLDALPYFDGSGFVATPRNRGVVVRGGPQRRTLYATRPTESPPLNRVPLVLWHWHFQYLSDNRLILPRHLNNPHAHWHSSPTACILRFAMLDEPEVLHNASNWEAAEKRQGEKLSSYHGLSALVDTDLKRENSRRYSGSGDLVDCGLLNPGQWF